MEDWDSVVSAVGPLTAQWDDLGRKLGIHRDTLAIIARNNKEITGLCLNETIAQWLQLNYITDRYSRPSWRSLAEAVVSLNKSLFLKIASHHEVKNEESITIEKEQPNLNDQAMTSAETVKPKPLLHENTDDKSAKFPWEFIPALTYPGLQLKDNFSKEQSEKYEVKLEQHSQEMIITFNILMCNFQDRMISEKVPVSKLKTFLRGLHRLSTIDVTDQLTISKDLMNAQTIDDMMLIIWSYCSFFNFSLIETMVDRFEQLHGFKPKLEEYKEAFAKYAEHKLVYCCPSGIGLNTDPGLGTEAAEIVVKLDDAYKDCRLTHLETLRKDLCQIFRIPLEIFPLEGVQPGSVCVVFQAPEFMKKEIFPLSEKQILALRELNYDKIQIYSVVCSEYSYDIREKQPYAGSDSGIGTFHSKVYPESDLGSDSGLDASYFVTKTMGLEYIKNMKDKFLQMSDKAIQLSTLSEMHMKAIEGDLESIVEMIENETTDYNPMNRDVRGNTALHYAAGNGHLHVIKYFVEELGFNCTIAGRDGITPLHCSASMGHQHIVEYLLDSQQVEALCHDEHNCTPLHYACREGHIGVVKQLADNIEQYLGEMQECNSSCLDEDNLTPLHLAAVGGHLSVIEYLIKDKECDSMCKNIYGNTPLHAAASCGHLKIVKFLIENLNGKPETLNKFGHSALHIAAMSGQLNIIEHLIEKEGYNPSCLDDFHHTPLHIAAMGEQPLPIFKYLILGKECDPLCRDRNGNIPLQIAASYGHMEVVQFLTSNLNCPLETLSNNIGQSPLHAAAIGGNLSIVQHLIEKEGFNPSNEDVFNITPLHYAAIDGYLSIVEYLCSYLKKYPVCKDMTVHIPLQHHHLELVTSNLMILYEGFSGHKLNFTEQTQSIIEKVGFERVISALNRTPETITSNTLNVLQTAVFGGHLNVVQHLIIKEGHDPSCLDEDDNTLLHVAARMGHLSIVKYFILDKICDLMSKNKNGYTPVHLAAEYGHMEVLQFLISNMNCTSETFNNGALYIEAMGRNLSIVQQLVEEERSSLSFLNAHNITLLYLAATNGHLSVVKYLILDKACNPMCKDVYGNTPLHFAALYGHMDVLQFLISNMKCTSETLNNEGLNALHVAAMSGKLNIVQYLIEKEGYSPFLKDTCDKTPLHFAASSGHLETVKYLTNIYSCQDLNLLHNCTKQLPIHFAASGGNLETIKFLEQFNDLHSLDRGGWSCLHVAAQVGHLEAVRYFIEEHSFYPAIENYDQVTPLHLASWQGHLEVIIYLIFAKCNPLCRDKSQDTPLHWAASEGQLETVKFFIEVLNLSPFIKGEDKQTILGYAELYGHDKVVEYIISTLE